MAVAPHIQTTGVAANSLHCYCFCYCYYYCCCLALQLIQVLLQWICSELLTYCFQLGTPLDLLFVGSQLLFAMLSRLSIECICYNCSAVLSINYTCVFQLVDSFKAFSFLAVMSSFLEVFKSFTIELYICNGVKSSNKL